MNIWRRIRRWLGFPGFDYQVQTSYQFADYYLHVMDLTVREDVAIWLNKAIGEKNWKVDMGEYDAVEPSCMTFKFRHSNHAVLFKVSWL